jgi:uncharacterized membrane protein YuzA (DUF378 family)
MLFKWLLIIGGLNWGLVGLASIFGGPTADWNLVHLIFGFSPVLVAIIYILVGLAGVVWLFGGCKHGKHASCVCESDAKEMNGKMQGGGAPSAPEGKM